MLRSDCVQSILAHEMEATREPRTRTVGASLDAETRTILADLGRREDRSKSAIVRQAVKLYAEAEAAKASRW